MEFRPVGILELFRNNRNFRSLYFARLVSLFGDWFTLLAVLALLREIGGRSAGDFGWVLILNTLPQVLVAPVAGVVADRFSRRGIMFVTDVLRGLFVLGLIGLAWFPSVWALYLLVSLKSATASFYEPARSAILPDVVSAGELTAANAIGAATWSAMLTLGAAAGGVFTAYLGWQAALWVDLASYLLSMLFLLRLVEPEWEPRGRDSSWTALLGIDDIREGVVYVLGRPRVWSMMLVKSGWCLAGAITLMLTLLGETVYVVPGSAILGVTILYAARGVGTGIGPFLSRWLARSEPEAMERAILVGYLCGACFYLLLPFTSSLLWASLLVVCAHLGGATIWVFSTVRLQQMVPTEVRGRVFAAQQAGFTVMISLTTWLYGWVLDHQWASVRTLVFCLGGTLLVPSALWAYRGWRLGWAKETLEERAL